MFAIRIEQKLAHFYFIIYIYLAIILTSMR